MLAFAGAQILGPVATCADAMQLLQRHDVDAAVLDIQLRDEEVYPVAAHLHDRRIPFVFVSGYEHTDVPKAFAKRAFLSKPFPGGRLVEAVELLVA